MSNGESSGESGQKVYAIQGGRVSLNGVGEWHGAPPPPSPSHDYFKKQKPIKNDALPHEALPLLKNKISLTDKQTPSIVKWGPHSRKWFLKKPWKIRNCHNTCVSIIKQHWKKMAEIQQKHDFLTWNIQNFARNSLLESSILLN